MTNFVVICFLLQHDNSCYLQTMLKLWQFLLKSLPKPL